MTCFHVHGSGTFTMLAVICLACLGAVAEAQSCGPQPSNGEFALLQLRSVREPRSLKEVVDDASGAGTSPAKVSAAAASSASASEAVVPMLPAGSSSRPLGASAPPGSKSLSPPAALGELDAEHGLPGLSATSKSDAEHGLPGLSATSKSKLPVTAAQPPPGHLLPDRKIDGAWVRKATFYGLLVGGVFGMMGAGGSMILKPVLYYGFEVAPFRLAIFHGYIILFLLAMAAAAKGHARGLVCWRMVVVLLGATGFGSLCGSFQASMVSNQFQVVGFAVMLSCVALHMFMKSLPASNTVYQGSGSTTAGGSPRKGSEEARFDRPWLFKLTPRALLLGLGAGLMSGFMGVGGGFILVPVVCELGLEMERAVPTAQAVVSLSALLGFSYYMLFMDCHLHQLDLVVTTSLTLTGLLGIGLSGLVAGLLSNVCRQRTFAGMLAAIAVGMLAGQSGLMPS